MTSISKTPVMPHIFPTVLHMLAAAGDDKTWDREAAGGPRKHP